MVQIFKDLYELYCTTLRFPLYLRQMYASLSNFVNSLVMASPLFSRQQLYGFLQEYGVFSMGLWQYLFRTTGHGPGDGLKEWMGLICDSRFIEEYATDDLFPYFFNKEDAFLRAYTSPTDVLSLVNHPQPTVDPSSSSQIVSINLASWSEFYSFLNLSFSSALALLFHWPLTIYHILNQILPVRGKTSIKSYLIYHYIIGVQLIQHVLNKKSLKIHLIGVETEVDLLPVFKVVFR